MCNFIHLEETDIIMWLQTIHKLLSDALVQDRAYYIVEYHNLKEVLLYGVLWKFYQSGIHLKAPKFVLNPNNAPIQQPPIITLSLWVFVIFSVKISSKRAGRYESEITPNEITGMCYDML